jgi:hypothetical protein
VADVFISFIHEEKDVAKAVQTYLRQRFGEHQIAFLSADSWQMHAGEIWLDRIRQELSNAKVVILMLTQRSVNRPWVNFEAGAAWMKGTPIIPVCFGDLSKERLSIPYSGIQALNLPDEHYYLLDSRRRTIDSWSS